MTQKEKENKEKLFKKFMNKELSKGAERHTFDFKNLMEQYYTYYLSTEKYDNMLKHWKKRKKTWEPEDFASTGSDAIQLWYLYRNLDKNSCYKGKIFDCDSWNKTSDLTDMIYDILWRNTPWFISGIRKNFGGDTMHSFAYTFNALSGKNSSASSFQAYIQCEKMGDQKFDVLKEYAAWTGCIGNFTLVPKGFNAFRGKLKTILDYWDLSLHNLRFDKDGQDWLNHVGMSFHEYINTFFLWDYVDEKYHVQPLFPSHEALLLPRCDLIFPQIYEQKFVNEFEIFTDKANSRICRRGQFMVAMLQIADQDLDSYFAITKTLATDRCLGTMEDVVERLKNLKKENAISDEAVNILSELKLSALK